MTPTAAIRSRALERNLKRWVWSNVHPLMATCAPGLEGVLRGEIVRLPGVSELTSGPGRVAFRAPYDTLLDALLTLRSAQGLRLTLLRGVAASTFPMLFDQLTRVNWSLWLSDQVALTVRVRSRKSRLRDDAGLERSLRQAIRHGGIETGSGEPQLITLDLHRDRANLALDLGGKLHQRRGEKWVAATSIRETTAAALGLLAGLADLPAPDLIVDPFCGSGTLLIEALAMLEGRAVGRDRPPPFAHSPAWKPERWAAALRRANAAQGETNPPVQAIAADADPVAIRAAEHNLRAWGYRERVELSARSAETFDLASLARERGAVRPLLLSNPPYGKGSLATGGTPEGLVASLLERAEGWRFALLTPNGGLLARVPGVCIDASQSLITGGLPNAITLGRVAAAAPDP